jgi:hypothetical protein
MYVRTSLLIAGFSLLSVGAPLAQIRVYNPESGEDMAAPSHQGFEGVPRPQEATPPAARNATPAAIVRQEEDAVPVDTPFPLGVALAFVDMADFNEFLSGRLQRAEEVEGLDFQIYVQDMEPLEYVALVAQGKDKGIEGLTFRVDSGAYLAMRHNVKKYNTIVYIDPEGTRRYYDLQTGLDRFMRHVKRIEKTARKQRRQ